MPSKRVLQAAAVSLLAALAVTPQLRAGFKCPPNSSNPTFDGYPIGDGTTSAANMAKIAPTKMKLGSYINGQRANAKPMMPPLSGAALDSAACARLTTIRSNLIRAADEASKQLEKDLGQQAGKCLKDLIAKGAVCIDFGTGGWGGKACDKKPDCIDDKLNITVMFIGGVTFELPIFDPGMFFSIMVLYEEAWHALQDFEVDVPGDTPDMKIARKNNREVCNELEVEEKQLEIICELVDDLTELEMGGMPTSDRPLVQRMIDQVNTLANPAQKMMVIGALKGAASYLKSNDVSPKKCYEDVKMILDDFLSGTIDKAEANRRLGKVKWKIKGQTTPFESPKNYSGNSDSGSVRQHQQGIDLGPVDSGLASVLDIELVNNDATLLISGLDAGGLGSVVGVHDLDLDGVFQTTDRFTIVAPTPVLMHKLDLFHDGTGGTVYLFEGESHVVYAMDDFDMNGVPDGLGLPISSPDDALTWVDHFTVLTDGRMFGYTFGELEGGLNPDAEVYELVDSNMDGMRDQVVQSNPQVEFAPTQRFEPQDGDTQLDVAAMPGATLEVWELDAAGNDVQLLGSGSLPMGEHSVEISLSGPLTQGDVLLAKDTSRGTTSNPIHVLAKSPFDRFCFGDGGDQMGCTPCPCGNEAPVGSRGGCLNSSGSSARLYALGDPSVAVDTLHFEMRLANPSTFALLGSADEALPANPMAPCPAGSGVVGIQAPLDGLRCIGVNLIRHEARATDADGAVGVTTPGWGPPAGPPGGLIAQGGFNSGQTRHFMVFYREQGALGCSTGQSTSNGVSVTFRP